MYSLNAAVLVSLCHDGGIVTGEKGVTVLVTIIFVITLVFLAEKRRRRRQDF
jgi:hypothetical protein